MLKSGDFDWGLQEERSSGMGRVSMVDFWEGWVSIWWIVVLWIAPRELRSLV